MTTIMSHTENQPTLFPPPYVAVVKVTRKSTSTARPRWSKYRPVNAVKCDDCMLLLHLAKGNAPASRPARWKRKQGDDYVLLCYGHADVRREEDGMKPLSKGDA